MDHLRRWREERRARKEPQPKYWRHSMVFPVLPSYDSRVPVRAAQPIGDEAVPCQSFLKLPSEIRNAIYKEVFGGRVIHLYLGHGKRQGTWEPRGQICRRKWEVLRDTRYEPTREIPFQEPFAYDMCLGKDWGPDLEKFGVLGLLLACRQTYHESLPFLFSENTFYLEMGAAPALLHNFKSILPESHLVRVTSLELTCYFKCFTAAKPWDGHRYCVDLPNRLIDTFPNLKSLKLVSCSPELPKSAISKTLIDQELAPVDRLIAHYAALRPFSCWLVIGSREFFALKYCLGDGGELVEKNPWIGSPLEIWRSVDSNPGVGYWIAYVDTPATYATCFSGESH